MNTNRRSTNRPGLTLLELIVASSMLAVLMTSLTLVLRTSRVAWDTSDGDYSAMHHAATINRHLVRQAREARAVTYLSSDGSEIELEMTSGEMMRWSHASAGGGMTDVVTVTYASTGDSIPLAQGIRSLSFLGYEADGTTLAASTDDIQVLEIRATVDTPLSAQPTQTVSSFVWIRAW